MIYNLNNFQNEINKLKDSVENSFTYKPDNYYIIPDAFYKYPTFLKMLREAFPNLTFNDLPEFVFHDEKLSVEAILFDGNFCIDESPVLDNITRSKATLLSYTQNKNFQKDKFPGLVHLSLWNDKEFILSLPSAVISYCIQFFSEDFLEDKKFVLKLAQVSTSSIRYVSEELLKDDDVFFAYSQDSIQLSLALSDERFFEVFNNYQMSIILLNNIEKKLQQNKNSNFFPKLCLFLNKLLNHPKYIKFIDIEDVFNKEEFSSDNNFKRFFHTGSLTFSNNIFHTGSLTFSNNNNIQNHFEHLLDKIISKVDFEIFKIDNQRI